MGYINGLYIINLRFVGRPAYPVAWLHGLHGVHFQVELQIVEVRGDRTLDLLGSGSRLGFQGFGRKIRMGL